MRRWRETVQRYVTGRVAAIRAYRLNPGEYRTVCFAALVLLGVIVVSGAAVRLTGSGLGCDDWPRCNSTKFVDVSSGHAAIEQVNRLFTGLVSAGVIAAVLGSLIRTPRRRDLTRLSLGLVAGVVGQVVLGGITVKVDLHPAAVQAHLLLSMVLIANAVVLVSRAGMPSEHRRHRIAPSLRHHVWICVVATIVAIVAGTVVTGAGPHAGDEDARRFGVSIARAAQVHGAAVWLAVGSVVVLMFRLRHRPVERAVLDGPLVAWICVAVGQAGVGYLQYFTGVPAALVAVHVAGATLLWAVTVSLVEATSTSAASIGETLGELGALVDDQREEPTDFADEVPERVGAAAGVAPERYEQEQHQDGEAQLLHGFERHGTTSN
jgi:cytochrome c oxidase assembly protein subunit 15